MSGAKVIPNPLKAELRLDVEVRLADMTDADRDRQSKIILSKIFAHPKYKSAKRISFFLSLPNEVPTEPILNDILLRGDVPFVPQYSRGQMRMLRVLPGDLERLVPLFSKFTSDDGIHEELRELLKIARETYKDFSIFGCKSYICTLKGAFGGLDLVIAPGAAFTRDGWRCGHGGGYYDRYLAGLLERHQADPAHFAKPYILAVGFNQQIYPEIPVDIQDVKVDEVLTAE